MENEKPDTVTDVNPFAKIGSTLRIRRPVQYTAAPDVALLQEATQRFENCARIDDGGVAIVPIVTEPEVTPEMVAAVDEYNCYFESDFNTFTEIVTDIYRAMHAHRPAPVPDTPKQGHDWTRVNEGDRRRVGL